MAKKPPIKDAGDLVRRCLGLEYFEPNADGVTPIPVRYTPGKSKLIVAVGENASGKSFFRRVVQGTCSQAGTSTIHLSMEGRRQTAYNPGLCFVYGSEEWQSTGANSSETILGAIRTSQGRDSSHVIFWDEPDIGLSDSWAASAGAEIRAFLEDAPEHLLGAVVVTHSKSLLRNLTGLNAHFLCFGDDPVNTLTEWLDRAPKVRPLSELKAESHRRFKLIQDILNAKGIR
jgi:hypothetical protein